MVRLQNVSQTIKLATEASLARAHQVLVETAEREHGRVMTTDPRPSTFEQIVDGKSGAEISSVKPNGIIVFQYQRLKEVAEFVLATLIALSPVLSGKYRSSHRLFVNGQSVDALSDWDGNGGLSITNTVPYSRKIEVGAMKMRVPGSDEVYQQARTIAKAKYGNIADIEFTFLGVVDGLQVDPLLASSKAGARRRGRGGRFVSSGGLNQHNKAALRYPVILINPKGSFRQRYGLKLF